MNKQYRRGRKTTFVAQFLDTGFGQCVVYTLFGAAVICSMYLGVPA